MLVAMPRPASFIPTLARSPASTTVRNAGPSSCRARRTTVVSAACSSQSQFWPISRPPPERLGETAKELHSAGGVASRRASAENMISVRTFIARMSLSWTPAPSAIPAISSMYLGSNSTIGARNRSASSRTSVVPQPV